jgi:2-oxoisovalerate dehydrogenase E1 component
MVAALNQAYRETLENGSFHIGEDICDPYGGAFKVTKGLSSDFPSHVRNSSISEAGIVGIGIGMSITGTNAFVEIMFGDFMTHSFDQIISNASKFHHMYAFQVSVPLRIRTPMGGKRGYGPTHSQSLEKHFVGIDNLAVIALTSLLDPNLVVQEVNALLCPVILMENKVDYGRTLWSPEDNLFSLRREASKFGSVVISPTFRHPTITIVSYGETARHLADNLREFFIQTDFVPELICLIKLNPIDVSLIIKSALKTKSLLVVEDGSINFGIGAEIVSQLAEHGIQLDFCLRVGADAVPIPSIASLEIEVLPSIDRINRLVNEKLKERHYD